MKQVRKDVFEAVSIIKKPNPSDYTALVHHRMRSLVETSI